MCFCWYLVISDGGTVITCVVRVSFSFLPKGKQNEIVWIIGDLCAKHVAN